MYDWYYDTINVCNTYWTRHIGGEGSGRPHRPLGPLRGQAGLHRNVGNIQCTE